MSPNAAVNPITADLNQSQREAVEHGDGPVLVFAGAGSGKTRVLTRRIAWLIKECKVRPHNILAVTFTNKAANEMKSRIGDLLGTAADSLWAGTFHGICAKMLRISGEIIGVHSNFTIFDEDDQLSLVRDALEALHMDPKMFPPHRMLHMISTAKEKLVTVEKYHDHFVGHKEHAAGEIYKVYQEKLEQNRGLDFDDLIMKAVLLLRESADVREKYQQRFHYVLVDEYQDINRAQYELVRTLAAKHRNIFCVGDDDQSIYRWRGADVSIILQFEEDYPDASVYLLEQNYRSTKKILEAANHVVKRNRGRAQKKLWTENDEGCDIEVISSANEVEEASSVVRSIKDKVDFGGRNYSDFAILYRINAQSRALEEALMGWRIPHKIVGGLRFYERKEVKDIIAYLRLAANPRETVSFKRVVNMPARGIGDTSLRKLEVFAASQGMSLLEAAKRVEEIAEIQKRTRAAIAKFAEIIHHLHELSQSAPVSKLTSEALETSGYVHALEAESSLQSQTRLENVKELLSVTAKFEEGGGDTSLSAFLEQVSLISDIDTYDESGNAVTLMTLHSAKGLEFPVVYLVGMEEGLFPHRRSSEDNEELEEERRLCYVGMTRAREELLFSHARLRNMMGQTTYSELSRFIREIPDELFAESLKQRRVMRDATWRSDIQPRRAGSTATFRAGQKVTHAQFGRGIVLNSIGSGHEEQVTVAFEGQGIKKLLVEMANLQTVDRE
jgi:DNA helicase-2/ATP-dependent DNA helicase PcrA